MPTVGDTARGLRDRRLGTVLILVVLLVAALLVSRGCQRSFVRITSDQAVVIGQRHIDFRPEGHTVRLVQRGIPPKGFWAVSYWVRDPEVAGRYSKVTVVLIDANKGTVESVIVERP